MSTTSRYGLIILGNSGVGKSFLANVITSRDVFLHHFQATSVTHNTTSVDVTLGSETFAIFDIPGLIEAQQERIDLNKQEIDKAFSQRPNSIILFVFGQVNGRLRGQDIAAFNAINAAYPFRQGSLLLVVNGVPKNRPSDYAQGTLDDLQILLKNVNVSSDNLYFTDFINVNDGTEKLTLKNRLVPAVMKFVPQIHQKKQDIQTVMSQLKDSERAIENRHAELTAERGRLKEQLKEHQRIADLHIAEQQRIKADLEARRLKQEQDRIAAEHRRTEERARQEAERVREETKLKMLQAPTWQHASNGYVPPNAVVGGHVNHGRGKLYVARFTNSYRQLAPGKLYPPHKGCYNGCCFRELWSATYEVLTHPLWKQALKWVATTGKTPPAGAVRGGIRSDCSNEILYVCRGYLNGSLVPGKFLSGSGALLPYGGTEHYVSSCEVLVWTSDH